MRTVFIFWKNPLRTFAPVATAHCYRVHANSRANSYLYYQLRLHSPSARGNPVDNCPGRRSGLRSVWVSGQVQATFTRVRANFCTDKNLHGSTVRLPGTGGNGGILERLSVQVWDLKKAGPKLAHLAVQKSVYFRRSRVNARRNRASFCSCKNLFGSV